MLIVFGVTALVGAVVTSIVLWPLGAIIALPATSFAGCLLVLVVAVGVRVSQAAEPQNEFARPERSCLFETSGLACRSNPDTTSILLNQREFSLCPRHGSRRTPRSPLFLTLVLARFRTVATRPSWTPRGGRACRAARTVALQGRFMMP